MLGQSTVESYNGKIAGFAIRRPSGAEWPMRLAGMAQLAQNTEAEMKETVKKTRRKARDQLQVMLEKRQREDEIRQQLADFAEEMERAREKHARLL